MPFRTLIVLPLLVLIVLLQGCAHTDYRGEGMFWGGLAGAVVGHAVDESSGGIWGLLVGGGVGKEVGEHMKKERYYTEYLPTMSGKRSSAEKLCLQAERDRIETAALMAHRYGGKPRDYYIPPSEPCRAAAELADETYQERSPYAVERYGPYAPPRTYPSRERRSRYYYSDERR